jgi:alpha-ketoglutarate-dependent 2,4-dichlorophenoxyacetate dioxygenase
MEIVKLHEHFAAEVTGLLPSADHPESVIDALKEALEKYAVIVIRDQQAMTDDIQIAFCGRFGTLQQSITPCIARTRSAGSSVMN